MTPKQILRKVRFVFITFSCANGSDVTLEVKRAEILRLLDDKGYEESDLKTWSWSVTEDYGSLHIRFFTP